MAKEDSIGFQEVLMAYERLQWPPKGFHDFLVVPRLQDVSMTFKRFIAFLLKVS